MAHLDLPVSTSWHVAVARMAQHGHATIKSHPCGNIGLPHAWIMPLNNIM